MVIEGVIGAAASNTAGVLIGGAVKGASNALVASFLERHVQPFLRATVLDSRRKAELQKNIRAYIRYLESATKCVASVAMPSGQFLLEEVYEPLSLKGEGSDITYRIEGYPRELLRASRCLLISDSAGMGKSTLVKYMARQAIAEAKNIPIFLELRKIRPGTRIFDAMCELVDRESGNAGREAVNSLFSSGNFIFIFDGLDELQEELVQDVTSEISSLASRYQYCYFVITSRKDYGAVYFPDFFRYEVCQLTRRQIESLISRYDQGRGKSRLLISKAKQASVQHMLGTPLLATLLYRAFDHRQIIPPKRTIFYRQVYEALYQDHDLSKGDAYVRAKQSALDIDDFHKLLRYLGLLTIKNGRSSFSHEEFASIILDAIKRSGLSCDVAKLRSDLLKSVPLFERVGLEYKWIHDSFQDYFFSQYILFDAPHPRGNHINRMFMSDSFLRFSDALKFVAEYDVSEIRKNCAMPMLEEIGASQGLEIWASLVSRIVDIFCIASLDGASSVSKSRSLVVGVVQAMFDVDLKQRPTIARTAGDDDFLIVVALKGKGRQLLALSEIDPDFFSVPTSHDTHAVYEAIRRYSGCSDGTIDVPDFLAFVSREGSIDAADVCAALKLPFVGGDAWSSLRKLSNCAVAIDQDILDAMLQ